MEFVSLLAVVQFIVQMTMVSGACINNKYSVVTNHTGCISKSQFARHLGDMTNQVKEEIVSIHNNLRAGMNATNMQKMVWDDELAMLSQMWADNCEFKHDSGKRSIPGRFTAGQNLGMGHISWSAVLNSWWDEVGEFRYDDRANMIFSRVGHFTQMAWAESAKVGCGWATCTNPEMIRFSGGRYFVCNYGAAGNNPWWKPYEVVNEQNDRRKCSSCPTTCDRNGLCDCGGKVCQNGGTLDINTCQCTCAKPYHVGELCALDCQLALDSRHCGSFWIPAHCQQFMNVPTECPHMCGICPLADFRTQADNITSGAVIPPPATVAPPTAAPPTAAPPTSAPTAVPPSTAPPTIAPPTVAPPMPPRRTTRRPTARPQTTPVVTSPTVVTNTTEQSTNTTKETTNKSIDITIEEKNGKTLISIPNKSVQNGTGSVSSNGSVRVQQQASSGLYSTLVLILQLL